MRTKPEDLAADVDELEESVKLAYQRVHGLRIQLQAAKDVYDYLNNAWVGLKSLADTVKSLPTIQETTLDRVRQEARRPL